MTGHIVGCIVACVAVGAIVFLAVASRPWVEHDEHNAKIRAANRRLP